eukprot:scaffold143491_cov28-Tisochrysis_lutea.AAC.3
MEVAIVNPWHGLDERADGEYRRHALKMAQGGIAGSVGLPARTRSAWTERRRAARAAKGGAVSRSLRSRTWSVHASSMMRAGLSPAKQCSKERKDEQHYADDEAHHGRGESVGAEALLHHAEAADADRPHEEHCASKEVGRHCHVLKFELAHDHLGCRSGACVEAACERAVERKHREEAGAEVHEEAPNGHDNVQPLHEVYPRVSRPVDRRVGGHRATDCNGCAHAREEEEGGEEQHRVGGVVVQRRRLHRPDHRVIVCGEA